MLNSLCTIATTDSRKVWRDKQIDSWPINRVYETKSAQVDVELKETDIKAELQAYNGPP